MNELRENLITRMIRIYGFEAPAVITFCDLCEHWPNDEIHNEALRVLCKSHEEHPIENN